MNDIEDILISSGVSASTYFLYKIIVYYYKNYYLKSECNNHSFIVSIEPKEDTNTFEKSVAKGVEEQNVERKEPYELKEIVVE
jgi:hypothetical protein